MSGHERDFTSVGRWLESLGLEKYSPSFIKHGIDSWTLQYLDNDDLIELGVESLGHRVKILKSIVRTAPDVVDIPADQEDLQIRLKSAEEQLRKLTEFYNRMRTDMLPLVRKAKENEPLPTPIGMQSAFPMSLTASLPTGSLGLVSSTADPKRNHSPIAEFASMSGNAGFLSETTFRQQDRDRERDRDRGNSSLNRSSFSLNSSQPPMLGPNTSSSTLRGPPSGHSHVIHADMPSARSPTTGTVNLSTAAEPFKSFRVNLDETCRKILPAVLRSYRIYEDSSNYRLFVSDGEQERELKDNEKPIHILKQLSNAGRKGHFLIRQVVRDNTTPAATPAVHTPGGQI